MYLTRAAVDTTLDGLASVCGAGSVVSLDFWQRVRGPGGPLRPAVESAMRWIGEPITFAIGAAEAPALLSRHGFDVVDLAEGEEMTSRYATGGRRCDPGMYVLAARLG
jgi:O-methyltransferase involved in polyketide biosynthesis